MVSNRSWRRSAAVVYALLRCELGFSAASDKRGSSAAAAKQPRWDVFIQMKEMNDKLYEAFLKSHRLSNESMALVRTVERHITSPEFQRALGLGDTAAPPSATAASTTAAQLQKS